MKQKAEKLQVTTGHKVKGSSSAKPRTRASLSPQVVALPFTVFEQVLFDYQLQGRIKLLDDFRRAFESHDRERVGIVNHVRHMRLGNEWKIGLLVSL